MAKITPMFYRFLVLCVSGGVVLPAMATHVEASLQGDHWRWTSVENNSIGLLPSLWDIPVNLPVADKVILGGVDNIAEQTLTVSKDSSRVNLPITLKGVQYRIASNARVEKLIGATSTAIVNGLQVDVMGSGASNIEIHLEHTSSPVTHFRPIIAPVTTNVWVDAFSNANAERGMYQGILPFVVTYDFVRNGIRLRQLMKSQIFIKIDYAPEILSDVIISPSDAMTVTYHYPQLVSGETTYLIEAAGYFTDGVWIGLQAPTKSGDKPFSLTSSDSGNVDGLPYTVRCISGCSGNTLLIDDGQAVTTTTANRPVMNATNSKIATARLRVSFERKPLVKNGRYSGTFTLIFEARI